LYCITSISASEVSKCTLAALSSRLITSHLSAATATHNFSRSNAQSLPSQWRDDGLVLSLIHVASANGEWHVALSAFLTHPTNSSAAVPVCSMPHVEASASKLCSFDIPTRTPARSIDTPHPPRPFRAPLEHAPAPPHAFAVPPV